MRDAAGSLSAPAARHPDHSGDIADGFASRPDGSSCPGYWSARAFCLRLTATLFSVRRPSLLVCATRLCGTVDAAAAGGQETSGWFFRFFRAYRDVSLLNH
ncbi:hypothetical protein MTO96_048553 [Rhipicephalus appendiculatus]